MSPADNVLVNSKRMARTLLLGIEHRGPYATGFAFRDSTGMVQVHKQDLTASDFVKRRLCLPKRSDLCILHTRTPTKGAPEFNVNNHPIATGRIVGVHNGWLTNDHSLWDGLVDGARRIGEVDSEVIFALLAHGKEDSGITTIDALEAVRGNVAVAWFDNQEPDTLYLARGHGSPLIIGQTERGSLIFASTDEAVFNAAAEAGLELTHLRELEEGRLLTVDHGDITNVQTFTPDPPYTYTKTTGTKYMHGGAGAYGTYGGTNVYGQSTWDDEWVDQEFGGITKPAKESAEVFTQAELLEDYGIEGEEEPILDWIDRTYFDTEASASVDRESYIEFYSEREEAIDSWFGDFRGGAHAMCDTAKELHAYIRPGDYVQTELNGATVPAQVLMLPRTFPEGKFVLRCFTRAVGGRAGSGVEAVLVERHPSEFQPAITTAKKAVVSIASARNR